MTNATTTAAVTKTNADKQKAKLVKCEAVIRKGQTQFIEMARAVLTIRDEQLYKPEFKTFSAYFESKWDMTPQDVTRYTNAGKVLSLLELHGFKTLPSNEGQTRALAEIKTPEKQLALWDAAIKSGEKITAKVIRKLANPSAEAETPEVDSENEGEIQTSVEREIPREKNCSATLLIEMDSSVLKDALEYKGVPCTEVLPGQYQFKIATFDKASLFTELASWSAVYALKKVTVSFE